MFSLKPSAEFVDRAYQECGTSRTTALEDIKSIAQWLQLQPHLPKIEDDNNMFLENMFLRSKCSVERCKQAIDMHFTVKTALPEIFQQRDPSHENLRRSYNYVQGVRLPKLTHEGYNVLIYKQLKQADLTHYEPYDGFSAAVMLYDRRLLQDLNLGDVVVYDVTHLSMGHITRLTLPKMKKMMVCFLQGYHIRFKGIHFYNPSPALDMFLKMVKPMVKSKLFARIHVHADLESIHKHVDKSILPQDYGGDEMPLDELHEQIVKEMDSHRDWFLSQIATGKADESKRPGKRVNSSDLLGIEGNFKKLELD